MVGLMSQEFFDRVGNRMQAFWLQPRGPVRWPGGWVASELSTGTVRPSSSYQPRKSQSPFPLWSCPLLSQPSDPSCSSMFLKTQFL